MPIFPIDGGRPVATQPMRPADATYGAAVVDEHLGALLGEHLLPVRSRNGAADEPYLLAVDIHGGPVVVEVVGLLDGATLLRALVYLGRAARLSLRDLAAVYRGGSQRFAADLATFRESVPAAQLLGGAAQARLLLVCAQVGDGIVDAVGALAGRGVEVLQVNLVDGPGGRLIDVSPVGRAVPDGSWSVANGVATLHTPDAAGIGQPPDEDTISRLVPERPAVVTRVPTGIRAAVGVPAQNPSGTPGTGLPVPTWSAVLSGSEEVVLDQPEAIDGHLDGPVGAHAQAPVDARRVDARADTPVEATPEVVAGDGRLARLAESGPVVLVWHRRRRGEYLEALVHPGGVIELADGTRVIDPSAAAEIASGSQAPIDGWRVWRVTGEDGPSLGEACQG